MSESRACPSMPTWTVGQERELLAIADEMAEVWESFAFHDGPGIVSARLCKGWSDRILAAFDGSGASEESKMLARVKAARGR